MGLRAVARQIPVPELEFLRFTRNHAEFTRHLRALAVSDREIGEYADAVTSRWFQLGRAHLRDARKALAASSSRAVRSRSYYAAYNCSKAVRYRTSGSVSLKADDHGEAASLPSDFPDVARWGQVITRLYEDRLRADYDNWATTARDYALRPGEAVALAGAFVRKARSYLKKKHGLRL